MIATDSRPLKHFLELAMQGKHAGSSGGEQRAYRLAKQIVNDAPGLDGQALSGLCQFVYAAVDSPTSARELVD